MLNISSYVLFYCLLMVLILLLFSLLPLQPYGKYGWSGNKVSKYPVPCVEHIFASVVTLETGQVKIACLAPEKHAKSFLMAILSFYCSWQSYLIPDRVAEIFEGLRVLFLYSVQRCLKSSRYWTKKSILIWAIF